MLMQHFSLWSQSPRENTEGTVLLHSCSLGLPDVLIHNPTLLLIMFIIFSK